MTTVGEEHLILHRGKKRRRVEIQAALNAGYVPQGNIEHQRGRNAPEEGNKHK